MQRGLAFLHIIPRSEDSDVPPLRQKVRQVLCGGQPDEDEPLEPIPPQHWDVSNTEPNTNIHNLAPDVSSTRQAAASMVHEVQRFCPACEQFLRTHNKNLAEAVRNAEAYRNFLNLRHEALKPTLGELRDASGRREVSWAQDRDYRDPSVEENRSREEIRGMRRPAITPRSTSLPPQENHKEEAQGRVFEDEECNRRLIEDSMDEQRKTGPRIRTTIKNTTIPRKPVKVSVVAKSLPLRRVDGRSALKVVDV